MIIIFGGSFNPPHNAHLIIKNYALEEYKPDDFFIIPAPNPPHKKSEEIVEFKERVRLVKEVFNDSKAKVSEIENKLPKPSYTLQTVEYFKKIDTNIFLLIGEDSLRDIKKWHKWQELVSKTKLIVYPRYRDGSGFNKADKTNINYNRMETPLIEISSTLIRKRIKNNKSIKGMVPDNIKRQVLKLFK